MDNSIEKNLRKYHIILTESLDTEKFRKKVDTIKTFKEQPKNKCGKEC